MSGAPRNSVTGSRIRSAKSAAPASLSAASYAFPTCSAMVTNRHPAASAAASTVTPSLFDRSMSHANFEGGNFFSSMFCSFRMPFSASCWSRTS